MRNEGRVYLVGAGCAEADLITVRGMELLRRCDAVVYDDLIADGLLELVSDHAEKRYMGKREGRPSPSQAEICAMLIGLARSGKRVVRLKGGDPFVFGRGGEEMLALQAAGISCEVVPGISSALAIPALAGIPVTHRGLSREVHIITGHTADAKDGVPAGIEAMAHLSGTLVFLMGLRHLPVIVQRLLSGGMAQDTPAAVISGGNAPYPGVARGTLIDIVEKARRIQPPAVILVGKTAEMNLLSKRSPSLAGIRVGLTGTSAVTEKLRSGLEAQGAEVYLAERSVVEPLGSAYALDVLCDGSPHWLVFTSGNGVRLFFEALHRQAVDVRRLHCCRFAAIGAATAKVLASQGILADLCPETFTGEALGAALLQVVRPGEDVYLFRSRRGAKALFEMLDAAVPVRDIALYDLRSDGETAARAAVRLPGTDYIAFASASGVEMFWEAFGGLPEGSLCVCIGEVTARALRQRGVESFLVASDISADGIVETIARHVRQRRQAYTTI